MLCGGQSRRMGQPKAWLPCGEEYLLPRVVRLVREAVGSVVVAGRRDQELPPLPADVEVVYDAVENAGPLAGMAAGFEALTGRCAAAFVCSCDNPLIRPELIRRFVELLGDAPAVAPEHEGRVHPLMAVYRISTRSLLEEMLASGQLRATDFVHRCGARFVPSRDLVEVDPNLDSLRNVNDPETYARVVSAMPNQTGR